MRAACAVQAQDRTPLTATSREPSLQHDQPSLLILIACWRLTRSCTESGIMGSGQCLYSPPGPNPPVRAQGRKLSQRRLTTPAHT